MRLTTLSITLIFLFSINSFAQNVGIGTSNPSAKLHITGGTMKIDTLAGTGLRSLYTNSNGELVSNLSSNDKHPVWLSSGNANIVDTTDFIGTTDFASLIFKTNNTEGMRISTAGFVGIAEENPQERLHVNGTIRVDSLVGSDTRILYADSDGNLLTNLGAGVPLIAWETGGNANTSAADHFIGTTDNQDLTFRTNNLERMRIKSDGSVGILTDAPTAQFHVNGSMAVKTRTVNQGITSHTTLADSDYAVFINRATGAHNDEVHLPNASGKAGRLIIVGCIGSEKFEVHGPSGKIGDIDTNETMMLICTGSNWLLLSIT